MIHCPPAMIYDTSLITETITLHTSKSKKVASTACQYIAHDGQAYIEYDPLTHMIWISGVVAEKAARNGSTPDRVSAYPAPEDDE